MAKMPGVKTKTDTNMNLIPFSWDEYLKDLEDKPAPKCCFKQAVNPPVNEFKAGMKLESRDPRNSMSYCIATVVGICGPRLCLRLDGSDNRNDFWSLIDSGDIHPCGWCEGIGEQLQPPLGFAKNASYYPAFLQKLLSESKDCWAPESCFKDEPPSPPRNMFEVGMKLEAIDRKNPYLIGPATVGDVDGDKILVQFDGWRGAFDYWCKYTCRDIFPVGWCSSTGHPLQPPGTKGNVQRGRPPTTSKTPSLSPNLAVHIETYSQNTGVPSSPGSTRSAGSKKNSPNLGKLISPAASLSPADLSGVHVSAYVNQTCQCGPHLNQTSVIRLPLQYGPHPINRTLKKVVQALVESANNPAMIFNNLSTAPSNITITAKISGKTNTCTLPPLSTEQAFQTYISNLLNRIECCVNLVTTEPLRSTCVNCGPQSSGTSVTTSEMLKRPVSMPDSHPPTVKRPKHRTLSVTSRSRSRKSLPSVGRSLEATSPLSVYPYVNGQGQVSELESPAAVVQHTVSCSNPMEWTVDDVISYIRSKDPSLAKYAHLISSHEIDGRAFLLMSSDIVIKYMNIKVGPALKLCSLIDQLKISMRY